MRNDDETPKTAGMPDHLCAVHMAGDVLFHSDTDHLRAIRRFSPRMRGMLRVRSRHLLTCVETILHTLCSPNGATRTSPGHRPGYRYTLASLALKERNSKPRRGRVPPHAFWELSRPYRAGIVGARYPRAMPWAVVVLRFQRACVPASYARDKCTLERAQISNSESRY